MAFRPPDRCYTCYKCRHPLRKLEKSPTQLCREVRAGARMIELINWILEEGRDGDDLGAILAWLGERLVSPGGPPCRAPLPPPTPRPPPSGTPLLSCREQRPHQPRHFVVAS